MAPKAKSGMATRVELVARVGNVEVLRKEPERVRRDLEGELGQVLLPWGVNHPQRHAVNVDRLGGLQGADHERHQVGGHLHGGAKEDVLFAA